MEQDDVEVQVQVQVESVVKVASRQTFFEKEGEGEVDHHVLLSAR